MSNIIQSSNSSLSDFELLDKLGKGSYGTVWKAKRLVGAGGTFCIKIVALEGMDSREKADAVNEARLLSSVDNPNVCRYFDAFLDKNRLCLVMELAERGSLQAFLKERRGKGKLLSEDQVWAHFIQLCLGLHALHSRSILHRDVKCANVFLASDGRVLLGDLGVSRMLASGALAHTFVGTPFYLSPELCEGKDYGFKSDVWALGCVLYELATLRHPFEAPSQAALVLKIINGKHAPISTQFSAEIRRLARILLSRDSALRPTVQQILSRKEVIAKAEELRIVLPGQPSKPKKEVRKKVVREKPPPKPSQRSDGVVVGRMPKKPPSKQIRRRPPPPVLPKSEPIRPQHVDIPVPQRRPKESPSVKSAAIAEVESLPDVVRPAVRRGSTPQVVEIEEDGSTISEKIDEKDESVGEVKEEEVKDEEEPVEVPIKPRPLPPRWTVSPSAEVTTSSLALSESSGEEEVTWRIVDGSDDELGEDEEWQEIVEYVEVDDEEEEQEEEEDGTAHLHRRLAELTELVEATQKQCLEYLTIKEFTDITAYLRKKVAELDDDTIDEEEEVLRVQHVLYGRLPAQKADVSLILRLLYLENEIADITSQLG